MLTKPITAALTAACLLVPLWSTQLPGQSPDPTKDTPASDEPINVNGWLLDRKWEGLFGAWQLMKLEHATALVPDESIRGFLSFQEGFMTMVIHAVSADDYEPEQLGQAGMYRWQVTDTDVLQTATMIGHSNFGDEFEWEPPNVPREFRVDLKNDDLILTRPDLSRLIFRRVKPGVFPESALRHIREQRGGR